MAHQQHSLPPPERLHTLIRSTERSLRAAKPDDRGLVRPRVARAFDVIVAPGSVARAASILDDLLTQAAVEGIRFTVNTETQRTLAHADGEDLEVQLFEVKARSKHKPTPEERAEAKRDPYWTKITEWDYSPSGDLCFLIVEPTVRNVRRRWTDGRRGPLEQQLSKIIAGLHRLAAAKSEARIERERLHRQWAEEARLREEERRHEFDEQRRRQQLIDDALAWHKQRLVHEYIDAQMKRTSDLGPPSPDLLAWAEWARTAATHVRHRESQSLPGPASPQPTWPT